MKYKSIFIITYIILNKLAAKINFEEVSVIDGLSDNYCNVVKKDGYGFFWIGTDEGLNRYDGYGTNIYRSNPYDSTALSGNRIHDIFKDSSGEIWVATDKSIDKYIYGKDIFHRFSTNSRPTFIIEDKQDVLWVCTTKDGLFEINIKTGKVKNHRFNPLDPLSISSNLFSLSQKNPIAFDSEENVWIGTMNGLNVYNRKTNKFRRFFPSSDIKSISSQEINTLHADSENIWVGSKAGLDAINIKSKAVERYMWSKWIPITGQAHVTQIVPFKKGTPMEGFWIATIGGLVYFNKSMELFENVIHEKIFGRYVSEIFSDNAGNLAILVPQSSGLIYLNTYNFYNMYGFIDQENDIYHCLKENHFKSLNSNNVKHVYFDDLNNAWVSTDEGISKENKTKNVFTSVNTGYYDAPFIKGLDLKKEENELWISHGKGVTSIKASQVWTNKENVIKNYKSDPTNKGTLLSNESGTIKVLRSGDVWVASEYGGISVIKNKTDKIIRHINSGQNNQIIKGKIKAIYESNEGHVYVSSLGGVSIFDGSKFRTFVYNPNIGNNHVFDINVFLEDSENNFWVGTNTNGLFKINKTDLSVIEHYKLDSKNPRSFASSIVYSIFDSRSKGVMVGTGGEGLFLYNSITNDFDRITYKDGLPSNTIVSITEDKQGAIWAGTRNGVSKIVFIDNEKQVQSYNTADGLTDRSLSVGAITLGNYGKIFFGGPKGVDFTDPLVVETNTVIPNLAITRITKIDGSNNREKVGFSENVIDISHKTKTIEIEFVGLSFIKSQKNKYKYKLANHIDSWVQNGVSRKATFQGLPPGEYTFTFMASNNDGVWSGESNPVLFKVHPPVWKTWWAYSSYAGVLILAALGSVRRHDQTQRKRIEEDRRAHELEEAREFQMRMIPKEPPPNKLGLDISAGIKTATEVGGDYYDFFPENDSYYVAVGDATGHGMTAGMMVSITKAGLYGQPPHIPPNEVTYSLNRTIKAIELGKNKMAISIARFFKDRVEFTSAAMPPIYHYKSETEEVDEILLEGLPLGSFKGETYSLLEKSTKSGDAYVFISDGLPEATNISDKMLGYKAVLDCVKNNGKFSAQEIKQSLFDLGSAWLDGVQNQDDITIVVVKKK